MGNYTATDYALMKDMRQRIGDGKAFIGSDAPFAVVDGATYRELIAREMLRMARPQRQR